MARGEVGKAVLAYSGGLDTSVILAWLREEYGCEVVTFTADIGQGEEVGPAREKAQKMGVAEIYVEDLKETFVADYVFPMFRANALYEGEYLLGTSIARPLIARRQAEIARECGADAVAHGATGKGNDQVRFELGYFGTDPSLKVIAPWREWDLLSRERLVEYAESAPDRAEEMELSFERGDPVAIDGERLSPAALLAKLNERAGRHGIGRADIVENRYVGMKSRGCYETPGGTVLLKAHRAIESLTLDREVCHLKDELMPRYAAMVYNGYWWSPERMLLQKLIDESQAPVSGEVSLRLHKGNVVVLGRRSVNSLFDEKVATFEDDGGSYDQRDAEGFIRLNALRLRLQKGR